MYSSCLLPSVFFVSSVIVAWVARMSCAVHCLSFPRYTFMSCVSIQVAQLENVDAETLAFLCYVQFENYPFFEGNNYFVNSQIFGRVIKFGNCAI